MKLLIQHLLDFIFQKTRTIVHERIPIVCSIATGRSTQKHDFYYSRQKNEKINLEYYKYIIRVSIPEDPHNQLSGSADEHAPRVEAPYRRNQHQLISVDSIIMNEGDQSSFESKEKGGKKKDYRN